VLDRPPYDKAVILVAGRAFGGGSSREHAVWALADFGIRCVISTSFGEIFHANCFKNGVLPIVVDETVHRELMAEAEAQRPLTIDLPAQQIRLRDGRSISFGIEPNQKRALLLGLDEIEMILVEDLPEVEAFEVRQRMERPWHYLDRNQLAYFDDAEREVGTAQDEPEPKGGRP
jgi:3-isopropylmalate/(R)-2-methylmalate dehydratase small subunit